MAFARTIGDAAEQRSYFQERALRLSQRMFSYIAFSSQCKDLGNDAGVRHSIPKVVGGLRSAAMVRSSPLYNPIFDGVEYLLGTP